MTDKELVDWLRNCSIYEGRAFLRQSADRIEALEAENERLRETLAKIAALTRVRETRSHQSEWTQDVARAALGEKQ